MVHGILGLTLRCDATRTSGIFRRIPLPCSIEEEDSLPPLPSQLPRTPSVQSAPPRLQRQLRKVLEHHEVIEARQALLRRDLQELMQMLPPEAAEDTIVDWKNISHAPFFW
eukprot:s3031_g6.t1